METEIPRQEEKKMGAVDYRKQQAVFVQAALKLAVHSKIRDKKPYYAEVPACPGVWANGASKQECVENLQSTLEGWYELRLKKGLSLPNLPQ